MFMYCLILTFPQLVHLGKPTHGYMLLVFKKQKDAQVNTKAMDIINT